MVANFFHLLVLSIRVCEWFYCWSYVAGCVDYEMYRCTVYTLQCTHIQVNGCKAFAGFRLSSLV